MYSSTTAPDLLAAQLDHALSGQASVESAVDMAA